MFLHQFDSISQIQLPNDIFQSESNKLNFVKASIISNDSLQYIKLEIYDYKMLIDIHFFKLISFCELKPNTEIAIEIPKTFKTDDDFIRYKKRFELTKYFHKLNISLIFRK